MQQRINGDHDRYSIKHSKNNSTSRLTAIKRLADYCKQFSVTADIVTSTDERTDINWYEGNFLFFNKKLFFVLF